MTLNPIETIGNYKYVSVQEIENMLSRNHKSLIFAPGDVVAWCWECIREIGNFEGFITYRDVPLEVKNGKAQLPCNIFRILYVRQGGMVVRNYNDDGTYLHMGFRSGKIVIDYIGIAADKKGYPLIEDISAQACYWYCYKKLKWDEYIGGFMTESQWQRIEDNYADYWAAAKGSWKNATRDDMDQIYEVMMRFHRTPFMDRQVFFEGAGTTYGTDKSSV